MGFGDFKYSLTVVDARTKEPITSGVYGFVYTAGSKTLATIYSNEGRGAKTNPITRTQFGTDQALTFFTSTSTVDIFVADDRGNVSFLPSVSNTEHVVELNRDGVDKCFVAPFLFNTGGTETDTGLDFPLDVWIYNAMVEVVTADATETVAVGLLSSETAGDADGILVGIPLDNTGFIKPYTITDTTTEDYVTSPRFGALMGLGSAGTSAANDFGQAGGPGHVVSGSNARSLVYLPSTSDTGDGYIYVFFRHLR